MASPSPRIFTIPASAPFVPTLIEALLAGKLIEGFPAGHDPLALAQATLYLPTRRACRLARDMFLDVTGETAAILPRIVPIGDIDEDEIVFAQAVTGANAADALGLPEALGGIDRRLLLAQLVLKWATSAGVRTISGLPLVANSPATALALAGDLARLMDDMTTRQVPWDRLDDLVPDQFDEYWQKTLGFLKIAREQWPKIQAERDAIEPAARRDALIEAECKRIASRTDGPVIAAGSTGSMPATADLIAAIAKVSHGAVVLPGLDTDLDDESWDSIAGQRDAAGREIVSPAVGHPQFAMQALLSRLGVARAEVRPLGEPGAGGRELLVSEALRPAAGTDRWLGRLAQPDVAARIDHALDSMAVVEAANPEEEALAIAVALRETVEAKDTTAALITPDRQLARRVLAALARWNVAVDDSGGDPLADTPAGSFARLAAEATLDGLPPVRVLALLKHPLLRLGAAAGAHDRAVAALERAVLRGPRPRRGTQGLIHALETFRSERANLYRSDPRRTLTDDDLQAAHNLVVALAAAVAPLEALRHGPHPLADLVAQHRRVIELLSTDDIGRPAAFASNDGTALLTALDELAISDSAAGMKVELGDYSELFHSALDDRVVRRPGVPGVRVRIYGLLEARLQSTQRVVLGGLVEGVWPPETRSDPWLSRPMRSKLGLDLPERRISLSAHDFAQALGAQDVIVTYSAKLAGSPTVTSRFVQRLAAVAGKERWDKARSRGDRYLGWARILDAPQAPPKPATRPAPKPPVAVRPTRLSVTEIEHWLRDPYTIYAKHILRLIPLDPIDSPPGAADRGSVMHGAIGEFTKAFAKALPADPLAKLLELGNRHFAPLDDFPEARAFWWPRFQRIARWFVGWELERRAKLTTLHAEVDATLDIPLGARTFTLSTRADRIEQLADGHYAILDYKTGQIPTARQVAAGLSPQLTLEGAILREGRFKGIPKGSSISELLYVSITGGTPPGEPKSISWKDSTPDAEADKALLALTKVATKFEEQDTPYLSRERPMWQRRAYGDYDHLARVKEWSLSGGAGDDAGGEE